MKKTLFILVLIALNSPVFAQKYMSRNGRISFFSEAPLENIEAHNNQGSGVFDMETGQVAFSVLMKGFTFEKALMQEHFNENYVESDRYPKATFKGAVKDFDPAALRSGNWEKVTVEGDMTIHGATKKIAVEGEIALRGEVLSIKSTFPIRLADYQIKIPKAVVNNIAEVVETKVEFNMEPIVQ